MLFASGSAETLDMIEEQEYSDVFDEHVLPRRTVLEGP